jgi:hypothetical protein
MNRQASEPTGMGADPIGAPGQRPGTEPEAHITFAQSGPGWLGTSVQGTLLRHDGSAQYHRWLGREFIIASRGRSLARRALDPAFGDTPTKADPEAIGGVHDAARSGSIRTPDRQFCHGPNLRPSRAAADRRPAFGAMAVGGHSGPICGMRWTCRDAVSRWAPVLVVFAAACAGDSRRASLP